MSKGEGDQPSGLKEPDQGFHLSALQVENEKLKTELVSSVKRETEKQYGWMWKYLSLRFWELKAERDEDLFEGTRCLITRHHAYLLNLSKCKDFQHMVEFIVDVYEDQELRLHYGAGLDQAVVERVCVWTNVWTEWLGDWAKPDQECLIWAAVKAPVR